MEYESVAVALPHKRAHDINDVYWVSITNERTIRYWFDP